LGNLNVETVQDVEQIPYTEFYEPQTIHYSLMTIHYSLKYAKQTQFPEGQMSLTIDKISCYEKVWFEKQSQNKPNSKPKQTQFKAKTNPIKANLW